MCADCAYISKSAAGRIFQLQSLSCARAASVLKCVFIARTRDGVLSLIRSDRAHKKSRMLIKFDARGWKFNHTRARGQILMISSCSLAFPAFYFIFPGAALYYIRRVWNLLDCVLRLGGWARRAAGAPKKSYWYFSWSLSPALFLLNTCCFFADVHSSSRVAPKTLSLPLPATLCIYVCAFQKGPEKNVERGVSVMLH